MKIEKKIRFIENYNGLPDRLCAPPKGKAVSVGKIDNIEVFTYFYEDNNLEIGFTPIYFKVNGVFIDKTETYEGYRALDLLVGDEV